METKDLFLYTTTTVSLIISVAGYLLNRTLYNQNKVFDEKLKAYTEITRALNHMMNVVVDNLFEGQKFVKGKSFKSQDDMDNLADETDSVIKALRDAFVVNCLLLPAETLEKYDQFIQFIENEDSLQAIDISEADTLIEGLNERFDDIINSMRSDLDSEKLNKSLRKRIRGGWVHKFLTFNINSI